MRIASTVFTTVLQACHTSILGLILGSGMQVSAMVALGWDGLTGAGDQAGLWASDGALHTLVLVGALPITATDAGADTHMPAGDITPGGILTMDTVIIITVETVTR